MILKLFRPKYPYLLRLLYPERISRLKSSGSIYLTFDDGPIPEVTPWVLDTLHKYKAKATFFCIGENVGRHPEIFRRIIREGHEVGNHTFNHLKGWKTSNSEYLENILKAETIMSETAKEGKWKGDRSAPNTQLRTLSLSKIECPTPAYKLFRPPYGKIKNSQAQSAREAGYKIVMWDVISGDYDQDFSPEQCYRNVIENAKSGSTIVLHDSKKAFPNLRIILPKILEFYQEKGFVFRSLKDAL